MGIFGKIMDKIFHHEAKAAPAPSAAAPAKPTSPTAAPTAPLSGSIACAEVDVGTVLSAMADTKGGGGNYQSSIVDLLKLSIDLRRARSWPTSLACMPARMAAPSRITRYIVR